MPNFIKKHKILELIFVNEREKHLSATNYTETGMGLSVMQIHDKLKYNIQEIEILCSNLISQGYMKVMYYTGGEFRPGNVGEPVYCIVDLGKQTYIDKILLNQVWYRERVSVYALSAIAISLVALVVSILAFLKGS